MVKKESVHKKYNLKGSKFSKSGTTKQAKRENKTNNEIKNGFSQSLVFYLFKIK